MGNKKKKVDVSTKGTYVQFLKISNMKLLPFVIVVISLNLRNAVVSVQKKSLYQTAMGKHQVLFSPGPSLKFESLELLNHLKTIYWK